MKFGVIQFPGSCDEVDAMHAARRVADAELLWHADPDLKGADAVIVPGGFSYGDYLRAGAIARFAPIMETVIRFARDGGLVLGICNGFQVLCEAHLLPGALLGNVNRRFTSRQVHLEVVQPDTPFTRACRPGSDHPRRSSDDPRRSSDDLGRSSDDLGRSSDDPAPRLSIPAKHSWGRYYADEATLDEIEDHGQVVFRYAPGENFNGSLREIAGVRNQAGNVLGLMPHPEHAVDELTGGSTDGLCIFQSMRLAVEEDVAVA